MIRLFVALTVACGMIGVSGCRPMAESPVSAETATPDGKTETATVQNSPDANTDAPAAIEIVVADVVQAEVPQAKSEAATKDEPVSEGTEGELTTQSVPGLAGFQAIFDSYRAEESTDDQ